MGAMIDPKEYRYASLEGPRRLQFYLSHISHCLPDLKIEENLLDFSREPSEETAAQIVKKCRVYSPSQFTGKVLFQRKPDDSWLQGRSSQIYDIETAYCFTNENTIMIANRSIHIQNVVVHTAEWIQSWYYEPLEAEAWRADEFANNAEQHIHFNPPASTFAEEQENQIGGEAAPSTQLSTEGPPTTYTATLGATQPMTAVLTTTVRTGVIRGLVQQTGAAPASVSVPPATQPQPTVPGGAESVKNQPQGASSNGPADPADVQSKAEAERKKKEEEEKRKQAELAKKRKEEEEKKRKKEQQNRDKRNQNRRKNKQRQQEKEDVSDSSSESSSDTDSSSSTSYAERKEQQRKNKAKKGKEKQSKKDRANKKREKEKEKEEEKAKEKERKERRAIRLAKRHKLELFFAPNWIGTMLFYIVLFLAGVITAILFYNFVSRQNQNDTTLDDVTNWFNTDGWVLCSILISGTFVIWSISSFGVSF